MNTETLSEIVANRILFKTLRGSIAVSKFIKSIDSNSVIWLKIDDGVEMLVLRHEPKEVRALLKFAPGKGYSRHMHPEGEEVFVITGIYSDNGIDYPAGSYIYYPAESEHAPESATGCTIMVIMPESPINL